MPPDQSVAFKLVKAVGTMSNYDPLHLAMPLIKSGKELLVICYMYILITTGHVWKSKKSR